jgi:hypothetical protein
LNRSLRTFDWPRDHFGGSPASPAVALFTLALGVGVNTAIFTVVKAVLLDQLPYGEASRLIAISETDLVAPDAAECRLHNRGRAAPF